jgi:hypothetical protein
VASWTLLILRSEMTFQASSHGTRTEAALGQIPQATKHNLKDEVVVHLVLEAALNNVVAELVVEQRHGIGLQSFDDHLLHGGRLGDIDNLLSCPCTVLMNTDFGELGNDLAQHCFLCGLFAELEQLLHDSVAQVV